MKTSQLEARFAMLWKFGVQGPELVVEHRFHPERRWRFDFAHPSKKVAIEIEGGVYSQGRHQRIGGFIADCEKYLEAQLLGWQVFRLSPKQVTADTLSRLAGFIANQPTKVQEKPRHD